MRETLFQLDSFKIRSAVFADRTYKIGGEFFALIDISADFTAPAGFLCFLRLGFDILMIICVSNRRYI